MDNVNTDARMPASLYSYEIHKSDYKRQQLYLNFCVALLFMLSLIKAIYSILDSRKKHTKHWN